MKTGRLFFKAFACVLLVLATMGAAQTGPLFQHLLRVNCDGSFEAAPNLGLSVKLPIIRNVFNAALETLWGRAQCLCPNATRQDFDLLYNPIPAMMNNVQEDPVAGDACLLEQLPRALDQLRFFEINLPSTCTPTSWAEQNTCAVKLSIPRVNAELQLGLQKCPDSHFPATSISCSGTGCSHLGRPCSSNADCNGFECFNLQEFFEIEDEDIIDFIFSMLQEIRIYGQEEDSPGCYQGARGTGARTPSNDIFTNILSFVGREFFGAATDYSKMKFCGLLEAFNLTSENIGEEHAFSDFEYSSEVVPSNFESCVLPEVSEEKNYIDYFNWASGDDGHFGMYDALRLHSIRCPEDRETFLSQSSSCPWGNEGEWNDVPCFFGDIMDAYTSNLVSHNDICFPNCPYDISGTTIDSQDVDALIDDLVALLSKHYESFTPSGITSSSIYGNIITSTIWNLPLRLQYHAFEGSLDTVLSFYSVAQTDSEGLADEDARSRARQALEATFGTLDELRNSIEGSQVLCQESWSTEEFEGVLQNALAEVLPHLNEDGDGFYIPGPPSNQGVVASIPLGNYIVSLTNSYANAVGSIQKHELTTHLNPVFTIIRKYLDLNSDGIVSLNELFSINFRWSSAILISGDIFTEEFWPTDVSMADQVNTVDEELKGLFEYHASDGAIIEIPPFNYSNSYFTSFNAMFDFTPRVVLVEDINLLKEEINNILFDSSVDTQEPLGVLDFNEAAIFFQTSFGSGGFTSAAAEVVRALFSYKSLDDLTLEAFTEDLDLFDKMNRTTRLRLTLPGLQTWDGVDSSGTNVFTRETVIPPFQETPEKTILMQFTCDQSLIFEAHNFGVVFSQRMRQTFSHVTNLMKDLVACRTDPPINDAATFLTRYGVWSPLMWLHLVDESAAEFPLPQGEDWLSVFFNEEQQDNFRVSGLPWSCNFFRFLETGLCEFDFEGLKSLLVADITIRVRIQSCGANNLFSSYTIECLGSDCSFLTGLNPCDDDNDCSGSFQCKRVADVVAHIISQNEEGVNVGGGDHGGGQGGDDRPPDGEGFKKKRESDGSIPDDDEPDFSNGDFIHDLLLKTDFFKLLFGNEYNGNLCSPSSVFEDEGLLQELFGNSSQEECFGPDQWSEDLQRMVVQVLGAKSPNQGVTSKLHFCSPDDDVFELEYLQNWAMGLVDEDGPVISLKPEVFKPVGIPPTDAPTPPPTTAPTTAPTLPPISDNRPTCRCSATCGTLGPACSQCYSAGGMVVSTAPGACFCPSTGRAMHLSTLAHTTCPDPLPTCSGCNACHSSCATCFGTSAERCLTCANPSHVFVTRFNSSGHLVSGRCSEPCASGQHRNEAGVCVEPDCSHLSNCHGQGRCFYSEFTRQTHCRCDAGFFGTACQDSPTCTQFNDCSGNGVCIFNQHFRAGRCSCNHGWSLANCSLPVIKISHTRDTELGGRAITISHPSGFDVEDDIHCRFGHIEVVGTRLTGSTARCIVPPFPQYRQTVQVSIKINDGSWKDADESFFYSYSGSLFPRTQLQAQNTLLWAIGSAKNITWFSNQACLGSTVNITLHAWEWNPFDASAAPTLVQVATLASNVPTANGRAEITLSSSLEFSWNRVLHVVSVSSGECSHNRYAVVTPNTNYGQMCLDWKALEAATNKDWLTDPVPGCPPSPWTGDPNFEADPDCNFNLAGSNPAQNCWIHTGARECQFLTQPTPQNTGQFCCYNQQGGLILQRALGAGTRRKHGVGNQRQIRAVRLFVSDVLPSILCCRLSNNCDSFSEERPTDTSSAWIPPRAGGATGDPHFTTLDGKFWTFNGLGEYVLLERTDTSNSNFVIQGRLSQALNQDTQILANATVLSGFAVQDGPNVVSGYIGELEGMMFFVGGELLSEDDLAPGETYQSPNGEVMIFSTSSKHTVVLPSGVTLEVSAEISMISLVMLLPQAFKDKTRGLLGTWNGNRNDDFTLRNGTIIAADATQEVLFFEFGQTYAVTSETSLFTYPDGESFSTYNDPSFVPAFVTPQFASEAARDLAMAACAQASDVNACLFDVAATGDLRAANVALKAGAVFQTFAAVANTPPEFVNPPSNVDVRLNEQVQVVYQIVDAENDEISLGMVAGPDGTLNDGEKKFSFTVTSTMYLARSIPTLVVIATDAGGSFTDPVETNFTVVLSTCEDSASAVEAEVALDLGFHCVVQSCTASCAAVVSRVIALDDSCRKTVMDNLQESFIAAREKCCGEDEGISCTDETTSSGRGLSAGAIAGIAVGASVGGLLLIGLIVFLVLKLKGGSSRSNEHEMKEKQFQ